MASFYLALFHGQPDEMVAFVAATELHLRIDDKQIRTVEVHSLYVTSLHYLLLL